ncbi:Crp/Fnr family transcriptional regulator [Stakelama marina]|uniref:Crp/Fnr family transcriptional regulator n=1 Tax=Stakelama marina TaxID=2826939 RepID=A0A8T4IFP9_9SPHN|nr:Crp/Fnr family transcriptional regulator [Stakelama marina]MBR0553447.1 Crp/Fnr family transcriptional regulator [Stakelama marina]
MITTDFLRTHRTPVLTADDRSILENAVGRTLKMSARQIIVREGVPLKQCTLLLDGFIHRFKDTSDGRRQILAFHVPGDFVDLHSYPLKHLEHSVAASTDVEIAIFPHEAIRDITAKSPTLTELLWKSTLVDAAINREWLVSVGARSAAVRIAHLLCELQLRLERIERADAGGFALPMTQIDLADAVGLTPVHTNRMLRELRERKLADFREQYVRVHDREGLCAFADFDPSYLYLD